MRISDWSSDVGSSDLLNWGTDEDSEEGARLVEISYDRRGEVIGTLVQPAQDWEGRHPLPPDAGKGTLDPLSVIAGPGELLQAGGRCEGTFPVFDGRQRYDPLLSPPAGGGLAPPPPS